MPPLTIAPLKVVEPPVELSVRTVGAADALLMRLPPPPAPSANEATVELTPLRSRVAPEAICTGVLAGKTLWLGENRSNVSPPITGPLLVPPVP